MIVRLKEPNNRAKVKPYQGQDPFAGVLELELGEELYARVLEQLRLKIRERRERRQKSESSAGVA